MLPAKAISDQLSEFRKCLMLLMIEKIDVLRIYLRRIVVNSPAARVRPSAGNTA